MCLYVMDYYLRWWKSKALCNVGGKTKDGNGLLFFPASSIVASCVLSVSCVIGHSGNETVTFWESTRGKMKRWRRTQRETCRRSWGRGCTAAPTWFTKRSWNQRGRTETQWAADGLIVVPVITTQRHRRRCYCCINSCSYYNSNNAPVMAS